MTPLGLRVEILPGDFEVYQSRSGVESLEECGVAEPGELVVPEEYLLPEALQIQWTPHA